MGSKKTTVKVRRKRKLPSDVGGSVESVGKYLGGKLEAVAEAVSRFPTQGLKKKRTGSKKSTIISVQPLSGDGNSGDGALAVGEARCMVNMGSSGSSSDWLWGGKGRDERKRAKLPPASNNGIEKRITRRGGMLDWVSHWLG